MLFLGAWHFLPIEYYEKLQLRTETNVPEQVYDDALGDSQYDTIIYFHGNALDRTAPWRVDLYKVYIYINLLKNEPNFNMYLLLANFKQVW